MLLRRKWFWASLATLLILAIALSTAFGVVQRSATARGPLPPGALSTAPVPLSGNPPSQLGKPPLQVPAFSTTNILIGFMPGISHQQRSIIEEAVHAHEVSPLGVDNAYLVTVPSGSVLQTIHILSGRPGVQYAEPDYTESPAATPNDPGFPMQWGYQNTGQTVHSIAGTPGADEHVTSAWNTTTGSKAIVIGQVDTGVDYTHPDLIPNIWTNPGGIGGCAAGTHGYDAIHRNCNPMDDDATYGGHGTHVAGIMGASGNNGMGVTGVNWNTTILPVKWVPPMGSGLTSNLIFGLNWLLNAKKAGVNIRVINDSTVFNAQTYSQALSDEIDLLGQNGILFVTAAGNTSENIDLPQYAHYPCGFDRPTEICVAASDQNDNIASFSNYGLHTVDLAAPGKNIYSTLEHHTYGYIDGTSMASPQVAGAAALILSVQDMTPVQLKADIVNNVDPLPSMQGKLITGGRLDICKALPGCSSSAPTPTPTTAVSPTPTSTPSPSPTTGPNTGTFGLTSVGSNTDKMVPDRKRATKATLSVAGSVSKLTMYLTPTGTSGQTVMQGILYADQGGAPGALLGASNQFTFLSTNAAGWYDMVFPTPIALNPGTYWIGVMSGNATQVAGFRWNSVSQSRALNTNTYTSGPSNPYGTATLDSEQMSVYATYTTQSSSPTPTPTSTPSPTPTSTPTSTPSPSPTSTPTSTPSPTPTSTSTPSPTPSPSPTPVSGTHYKRSVTIDNTKNANVLSNYQVSFTLDTASLITAGKMRADCADLTVNDSDDATAIPNYWVENCNNAATVVWIKVPSIPASATKTIYLHYGSGSAISTSAVSNTFLADIPNVAAVWPMDEGSGTAVADTTGNGYTGTATTTTGIVAGKFGSARSFNGSRGYIQIANEKTLPFGKNARTVCSWALTKSLSGTGVILTSGTTTTDQFFALERVGSSLVGSGWSDDITVPNFFTIGAWNYVCLAYDGTNATLYGNGAQLAQTAKAWNTVDSGGTFIGNDYPNQVWNGTIDQLSFYTRALSASEIANLYHNYGYATGNDQGHQLIRSYSAPEPTATVGSELIGYAPSGTWLASLPKLGTLPDMSA